MSRGAIVADVIRTQARTLKVPGIVRSYESLGRQAREEHWTHEEYLHEVLELIRFRGASAASWAKPQQGAFSRS